MINIIIILNIIMKTLKLNAYKLKFEVENKKYEFKSKLSFRFFPIFKKKIKLNI